MATAKALRSAWSQALDIDEDEIEDESHFVELGAVGSIDAEAIFNEPTFSGMLARTTLPPDQKPAEVAPSVTADADLIQTCAEACGLPMEMIEDVFLPNFYSKFFYTSHQESGAWLLQIVFELTEPLDPALVCKAFEAIHDGNQAFRSRFVVVNGEVQNVVIKTPVEWKHAEDLETYKAKDWDIKVTQGQPAVRYGLVKEPEKTYIVWSALHSAMDGWTRKLLCDDLEAFLKDPDGFKAKPSRPSYRTYIDHVNRMDPDIGKAFWDRYLTNIGPQKPLVESTSQITNPLCNKKVVKHFPVQRSQHSSIRLSSVAHAAFGLLVANATNTEDVVYYGVRASRTIFPGAESIMGSVFSSAPVRIRFQPTDLVQEFLHNVQDESNAMMRHEPFGVYAVFRLSELLRGGHTFVFNWHPKGTDLLSRKISVRQPEGGEGTLRVFQEKYSPHTIAAVLAVYDNGESLRLVTEYDDRIHSNGFMENIMQRFMDLLNRICQSDQTMQVQELLDG
ncbi:MAG: hypothetical protein Q9181_005492 [Wetmoreana brouardii]